MARRSDRPAPIKISIPPEEALRRKYDEINLVEQDIGNDEVRLRVEEGADLDLGPDILKRFLKAGRDWVKVKPGVDERVARQEKRNRQLKDIVVEHPGLRGLFDLVRRRTVRIDTETDITYSRAGLQEQLGPTLYPAIVTETPVFRVEGMTLERARQVFKAGFAAVNMSEREYEQSVTESVDLEIREQRLYDLIKERKVDPEGIGEATMSFRLQSDEYTGDLGGAPLVGAIADEAELATLPPAGNLTAQLAEQAEPGKEPQ
jgi:hypothetical protein